MPLQVTSHKTPTGNSNLTLTNAAHCGATSVNTFVGQHNTITASITGNLSKVFRPGPDDECTTPYLCYKKCKCEQLSTVEPAEMVTKSRDDVLQIVTFSKLGEICTGATMYYASPPVVPNVNLKPAASATYAFLDGTPLTADETFIILPEVDAKNDPANLVRIVTKWQNHCLSKGHPFRNIPKTAFPIVCSEHNTFDVKMSAGNSVLHYQDPFTASLFSSLVNDVDSKNSHKRVQNLQKPLSDYIVSMLSGANRSQRVTLSAFKTPCRSLANRAALFQQLTLEIRPQALLNYTYNELFLTGLEFRTRSRLGKIVQPDLLVSNAQLDSIISVTARFNDLPNMSRVALMSAKRENKVEDLAAVLATIAVGPSDPTAMAPVGTIAIDETTTLEVDGAPQPLDGVSTVGTVLFGNGSILFEPTFIKSIYPSMVQSTSIIFTHQSGSYDLKKLEFFPHQPVASHTADIEAFLAGYSYASDSLISLTGASVLELEEPFNPTGVMVASSEVFISDTQVIQELETPKEVIVSDITTSSVQVAASDLDVHNTVSINYTATKPVMFMLLVVTCDALFTDVYGNDSGPVAGLDLKSEAERRTIFDIPACPKSHIFNYNISGVEQVTRSLRMGDTFYKGFTDNHDILTFCSLKLNGVPRHEIPTMSAAGRNPVALNGYYDKFAVDISRGSVELEFTGVYLLTFTSKPFGMIDEPFEHDCFSNFVNVVRIESVELILKFHPDFFGLNPSVVVQVDCFAAVPNIQRQMSGLMGNLLANDTC